MDNCFWKFLIPIWWILEMPPIFAKNAKNGSKFFKIYFSKVFSEVKFNSKGGLFYGIFWFGPSLKRYFHFLIFLRKNWNRKISKRTTSHDKWHLVSCYQVAQDDGDTHRWSGGIRSINNFIQGQCGLSCKQSKTFDTHEKQPIYNFVETLS